ncbi:MAG: metallophosphoesterase [Promethearchaeota archaeon]
MKDLDQFKDWGPYLSYGYDSSSEMRISWETEQYYHRRYILYGPSNKKEDMKKIEEDWCEPNTHHCFILKDLKPNTEYFYQIFIGDQLKGKIDERRNKIYKFKTGIPLASGKNADDPKNYFEFTIVGDMHAKYASNISKSFEIMDIMAPNRDFIVAVGDCIDDGNNESDWQAFFRDLRKWLPYYPIMNTTGNHDTNNHTKYSRFIRTWNHPFVDRKKGAYYSFRYGNAAFIMLDSNNAGGWEPTPLDDQYDWLESELEKYHEENLWIFVMLHHQIYSTGDFAMSPIAHQVYRPLFDEYHVDAVFYGHDHHFEVFWTNKNSNWGGTKYFVVGAGGDQNHVDYSIMGDRDGNTKYIWPGRIYSYKKHGIIPPSSNITKRAMGFRNDEIVKSSQLFGILEPHFAHIKIKGNKCNIRAIGYQKQVFFELNFEKNKHITN